MFRRFVNIVAQNYNKSKDPMYSLHRVDVAKHLFYRSRDDAQVMPLVAEAQHDIAAAGEEPPMIERLEELPAPCLTIEASATVLCCRSELAFAGLLSPGISESKVICLTGSGDALLYYADWNSTRAMPSLKDKVRTRPVAVSVGCPDHAQEQEEEEHDLYLMHKTPKPGDNSCFRVLRQLSPSEGEGQSRWVWESLPPPPFVGTSLICSHTVVDGGRTICLSTKADGIGTYCFHTGEREWTHAGDWVLPFEGRAEYVPNLKLWLGLSRIKPYYLCGTSDLSAMAKDQPPKLQHVWQDLVTTENWETTGMNLINLGSGRFCIARFFEVRRFLGNILVDWMSDYYDTVVLTGVEIDKKDGDEGVLAWRHRSIQCPGLVHSVL